MGKNQSQEQDKAQWIAELVELRAEKRNTMTDDQLRAVAKRLDRKLFEKGLTAAIKGMLEYEREQAEINALEG